MTTEYRIFANDAAGGPVAYGTVLDTTTALSWDTPGLALSSDNTFAVRVYDTVSGLEEDNVDARVRLVIDGAGADVTGRPNAPVGLTARAIAGGLAEVTWSYPGGGAGLPTGFHCYRATPAISYATPAATVAFVKGRLTFRTTLAGLTAGAVYQVAVRAFNTVAEESNTVVVSVTAAGDGPLPVDSLASTAIA